MVFTPIEEYMLRSREERRQHLNLAEPCIELGGKSEYFRGSLCLLLKTTMPQGRKIHLCHACHNGGCGNVLHMYWGTPHDNHLDKKESGTLLTIREKTIAKHGVGHWREVARAASRLGGLANAGKPKKRLPTRPIR